MNGVGHVRHTPLYIGYAVPTVRCRMAGELTVFRFFFVGLIFFLDGLSSIFVRNVGGCWKLGPRTGSMRRRRVERGDPSRARRAGRGTHSWSEPGAHRGDYHQVPR